MYKVGDTIRTKRNLIFFAGCFEIGEIFKIISHNSIGYEIVCESNNKKFYITDIGINEYFEKIEEKDSIDKILDKSEKEISIVFGNTFILSVKLPNGYVITESFFDDSLVSLNTGSICERKRDLCERICISKIKEKIIEMNDFFRKQTNFECREIMNRSNTSAIKRNVSCKNEITDEILEKILSSPAPEFCEGKTIQNSFNDSIERYSEEYNVDPDDLKEEIMKKVSKKISKEFEENEIFKYMKSVFCD